MAEAPDPVYVFKETKMPTSLSFLNTSMKKNILLVGREDGILSEWNLENYRKADSSHKVGISLCMVIKTLNDKVITQEKNGFVNMWTATESEWMKTELISLDYYGFCKIDVAYCFDGIVLCPKTDSTAEVFSVKNSEKIGSLNTKGDKAALGIVMAIKLVKINEQPHVLAAYESGDLFLWDLRTYNVVSRLKCGSPLTTIDFDDESLRGLCGGTSNDIMCFRINDTVKIISSKTITITNAGVECIQIRPDKKIVALGCWDGSIRIFSWKKYRPLAVLMEHSESITDLCFSSSPDSLMAVASKDKKISLWDIYSKKV